MGTRLKEETEFKPKPMVEVGGKPLLWHIMKIYSHYGYKNFILALGYKGDYVKDYFLKQRYYAHDFRLDTKGRRIIRVFHNSGTPDEFDVTFADTGLETPHGERVLKVKNYIKGDDFMVTYGDGVADIDVDKLMDFHQKKGKIATITGVHPISRWGLVDTDKEDIITNFAQKPDFYGYVNGGFMVFKKKFLEYIKPGDMIEDAFSRLIPLREMALYKHEGFWYGMDTYRDYLKLNELWGKAPKWKIWKE